MDILQIGEGGSSSNQKFKMIVISDIFRKGEGSEAFVNLYLLDFFESHINFCHLLLGF